MSLASNLYNLGALLKTNLEAKGVTGLNSNMGLTTLANKILEIPQSGGGCNSLILTSSDDFFQKEEEITINAKLNVLNESNVGKQINFSIEKENSNEYYSDYAEFSQVFVDIPQATGKGYYKNSPCVIEFELDTAETFDIYFSVTNPVAFGPNSISGKIQIVCDGSYITIYKIVNNERVTFNAWKKEFSQSYGFYLKLNSSSSAHDIKVYDDLDSCLFFNSVTDATGNASITYTGVGAGKLIVTASYGALLQETYEVFDCLFVDDGITDPKPSGSWVRSGTGSQLTIDDNGTTISTTLEAVYRETTLITGDFEAVWEAKTDGGAIRFGVRTESSPFAYTQFLWNYDADFIYYKLRRVGSTYTAQHSNDGVNWTNHSMESTGVTDGNCYFMFRITGATSSAPRSVTYKNLRIYSI